MSIHSCMDGTLRPPCQSKYCVGLDKHQRRVQTNMQCIPICQMHYASEKRAEPQMPKVQHDGSTVPAHVPNQTRDSQARTSGALANLHPPLVLAHRMNRSNFTHFFQVHSRLFTQKPIHSNLTSLCPSGLPKPHPHSIGTHGNLPSDYPDRCFCRLILNILRHSVGVSISHLGTFRSQLARTSSPQQTFPAIFQKKLSLYMSKDIYMAPSKTPAFPGFSGFRSRRHRATHNVTQNIGFLITILWPPCHL